MTRTMQKQWRQAICYQCHVYSSLLTFTCSEYNWMFKKSSPKAASTTCGQSQHLACTYLPRREREGIHDGCQEWRCCGTAQSPSTSTRPSQNNPHQVKYPRIQFYKMSQLYTRRHEKMELPPAEKVQRSQPTAGMGSACITRIQRGNRRLSCWSCKAQYHLSCMMSNGTQIVSTQSSQRWQYTHCSLKTVANSVR